MKAAILSAAVLALSIGTAAANPHLRVAQPAGGAVIADLRAAEAILASSGLRRGETLLPYGALPAGCVIELKTNWIYDQPVRSSQPLCRYTDGTIRPLR